MVNLNLSAKFTLSNPLTGSGVLSSTRDNATLQIETFSDSDNQLWYLMETNDTSMFRLHTVQKGDYWALDVFNYNGHDSIDLHFQGVGDKNGQYWRFEEWDDGSLKISNDFTGPDMHLEVPEDVLVPKLAGGDNPGQHWALSELGSNPTSTSTISSTSTPEPSKSSKSPVATSVIPSGTSTPVATSSAAPHDGNRISKGVIAGASIGGLIGLALLFAIGYFCWRKRKPVRVAPPVIPSYRQSRRPMAQWHL